MHMDRCSVIARVIANAYNVSRDATCPILTLGSCNSGVSPWIPRMKASKVYTHLDINLSYPALELTTSWVISIVETS